MTVRTSPNILPDLGPDGFFQSVDPFLRTHALLPTCILITLMPRTSIWRTLLFQMGFEKNISKQELIFCHVGPVCCTLRAYLWLQRKQTVGGDIFLRKTATSFFEHNSYIHRSNKITRCIKHEKNGFIFIFAVVLMFVLTLKLHIDVMHFDCW